MNIILFPVLLGLADRHFNVRNCVCGWNLRHFSKIRRPLLLTLFFDTWTCRGGRQSTGRWLPGDCFIAYLQIYQNFDVCFYVYIVHCTTVQETKQIHKDSQRRGWWWGKGLLTMSSMPLNLQSSSTFGLNVCVFSRWWEPGHHWFFTPKYKLWGTRRLLIFTREHLFVRWSGSCVTEL